MTIRTTYLTISLVALAACSSEGARTRSITSPEGSASLEVSRLAKAKNFTQSAEEIGALNEFLAHYPPVNRERLKQLASNRSAVLDLSDDPEGQRLYNRVLRAHTKVETVSRTEPVTAILVPSLGDATANALVFRRTGISPHDVIVLSVDRATAENLSLSLAGLLTVRQNGGAIPSINTHLRVQGSGFPASWSANLRGKAVRDIERLKLAPPKFVPGFGTVPAIELSLTSLK